MLLSLDVSNEIEVIDKKGLLFYFLIVCIHSHVNGLISSDIR